MKAQLRDYDFLARYAGDEFVAIVPETDAEGIVELCQRIEKAVDQFILPLGEGNCARVGISIGTGCYPNHGDTLDQIIIHADKAMYSVKAQRKQSRAAELLPQVARFEPGLKQFEPEIISCEDFVSEENYIVELDESHIVSAAVN
jgi:predicted signal transduction protein with EAL and GGDEF domain